MRNAKVPASGIKIEGFAAVRRLVSPFQHCFEEFILGAKMVNDAGQAQIKLTRNVTQGTSAVTMGGKYGCGRIKYVAGALRGLCVGTANAGTFGHFHIRDHSGPPFQVSFFACLKIHLKKM